MDYNIRFMINICHTGSNVPVFVDLVYSALA